LKEFANSDSKNAGRASMECVLQVAGSAEAGWKVLSILAARGLIRDFASAQCRVFSFGAVPWAKQQKTRVDVYTVHAGSAEKLKLFGLSQQLFPVSWSSRRMGIPIPSGTYRRCPIW
jgi:hypothetical protein